MASPLKVRPCELSVDDDRTLEERYQTEDYILMTSGASYAYQVPGALITLSSSDDVVMIEFRCFVRGLSKHSACVSSANIGDW